MSKIKAAKDLKTTISPNLDAFRTELSKVDLHNCDELLTYFIAIDH